LYHFLLILYNKRINYLFFIKIQPVLSHLK